MKPFTDPYEGVKTVKTTINPAKDVIDLIFKVHGRRGTMQTTINILLAKLHERLTAAGFHSYSPDEYERAILNASIDLGRPVEGDDSAATIPDDRRATQRVAQGAGGPPLSSCEVGERAQSERAEGGKTRKKRKAG